MGNDFIGISLISKFPAQTFIPANFSSLGKAGIQNTIHKTGVSVPPCFPAAKSKTGQAAATCSRTRNITVPANSKSKEC
jgi:hypothetical protein